MASLTQTRNPLLAYRVRVECNVDWREFQRALRELGRGPPSLLTNKSKLKWKGQPMYQPGEMTFRTRIPYEVMVQAAAEADDCHVLMETLALIDDYDGVRRQVMEHRRDGGAIVYPHDQYLCEEPSTPAPPVPSNNLLNHLAPLHTYSTDELWAELARRGLVATAEAVLVGNC